MTGLGPQDPTSTDGIGRWMAIQYVVMALWVLAIAVSFAMDADPVAVIAAMAISSFVIWFFVNPRRPWWGPGPRSVVKDRVARRRYQVRMTAVMIVVLFVAIPVAAIVVEASGS